MNPWIAALALAANTAPTLTLDEAIRIAEENAFSVRGAQTRVEKARQQAAEAQANLFPKLTAEGTYTKLDKGSTANFGPGVSVVIQPDETKTAKFTLSFPVDISGNIGRLVRASKLTLTASKETLQAQKNDLRLSVRTAYYRVLQAQELVRVAEDNLTSARERLENAKKQFEVGAAAKIDVLRFETLVASAEAQLLSSNNALRLAKQAFNNALSRPVETEFELAPVADEPRQAGDPSALVEQALRNRPELKAAQTQLEALAFVRRAEERGLNPSLGIAGVYQHNFDPGFGGRKDSSLAVATLTVPIWDSGVTRARVKAARQDEEQVAIQIEQLKLGLSLEVNQAVTSLTNALARLEVARRQAEFAAENFRLAKLRYEAGEAIQLEVLDAQAQDTQAKADLVNARYEALAAQAALLRAIGADTPDSKQ
ncbi:MAG: TolC family protein [Fimbriimonadales bacterium]